MLNELFGKFDQIAKVGVQFVLQDKGLWKRRLFAQQEAAGCQFSRWEGKTAFALKLIGKITLKQSVNLKLEMQQVATVIPVLGCGGLSVSFRKLTDGGK